MNTITIISWFSVDADIHSFNNCMNRVTKCVCVSAILQMVIHHQVCCFLGDHLFYATHIIHKYWEVLRTLEAFGEQLTAGKSLQSVTKSVYSHDRE